MKFRDYLPFITSRASPLEMKCRVYASCVRSSITYGSETRPLIVDVGLKFERAEMQMIRWMCGISMKDRRAHEEWLQTTQPTSGGAVTVVSSCCANCVEPPRPQQWGPDLPFFGHAGHADPLDGWRCCSQKRVMSRPIQVRQL